MSSVARDVAVAGSEGKAAGGLGRWLSLAAAGLGLVFVAVLIHKVGAGAVLGLLLAAGWWAPLVLALHLPQTAASAAGWGALLRPGERPPFRRLYLFRWIRESVNSLLPVAQIGGEVVRARLLGRGGIGVGRAGASCALDVTLELSAQLVFTLLGLAILAAAVPRSIVVRIGLAAVLGLAGLVALLAVAQRLARSGRGQALARRLMRRADVSRAAFRAAPHRQLGSAAWHLASWLFGALETWAAMRALGLHPGLGGATVVESLGQLVRVAGFAVPGAVGVQEGGLVLICSLFGIAPAAAIGLSLIRRLREVALGAPGLLAWRLAERAPVGVPA